MTIHAGTDVRPQRPYPGIEPFAFADQRILAARTDDLWNVLSNVSRYRASLLYGDSGSGKSSLVNAALIPELLARGYVVDRLRVRPRAGREFTVERIETGLAAPKYLPSTLAQDDDSASCDVSIADMTAALESATRSADAPTPFLIFDQFEEAVTLFEPGSRRLPGEDLAAVQESILNCLVRLMNEPTPRVKLLFVFRADYLAKLYRFFEPSPEVLDQYVLLLPPSTADLEEIIRAPFKDDDLRTTFERDHAALVGTLSGSLARDIAQELRTRSDGGRANLSELQIVCRQLWESKDGEELFRRVGVRGLLERYLSRAIESMAAPLRDPAIVILGHLVTAAGTRNIVSYDDLVEAGKDTFTPDVLDGSLQALLERRLIVREQRRNVAFYEIASEFLVPWIQEQQEARRARIRAQEARRQADEEARLAKERAESEVRLAKVRARKLRNGVIAAVVVAALAIAGGVWMYRLRGQAIEAEETARTERDRAENIIGAMRRLQSAEPGIRVKAIAEIQALVQRKQIPSDLLPLILLNVVNDTDPEVAKLARGILSSGSAFNQVVSDRAQLTITKAAEQNPQLARTLPPRLYIHIGQEGQRAQADAIRKKLSGAFIVPGVQNVGTLAPRTSSVRYFRDNESDRTRAADVAKTLSEMGIKVQAQYIPGHEQSARIRQGHFELWIAAPPDSGAAVPAPIEAAAPPKPAGSLTDAAIEQRNQRALEQLQPDTARLGRLLLQSAKDSGITAVIVAGYRSVEEQAKLYARGRTEPGAIVTSLIGGSHNRGLAFDAFPVVDGRIDYNNVEQLEKLGAIGKSVGLMWGGDFRIRDLPHFEHRPEQTKQ